VLKAGRYELKTKIGSGGMGHVQRAYDPLLQRNVAIKMLVLDIKPTADHIQRMQREAKALARLKHQNVVQILDFDITDEGQPFLVMDLIEGPDLGKILDSESLPLSDALEFGLQICRGLEHSHRNNILHRDLKPANVLIQTNDGGERVLKIIDLGLAKFQHADQKLTHTGAAIGSPYYMSPEQAKGAVLDERSDIYSFGCLLFEMLAGRPPFQAASAIATLQKQVSETPPTLSAVTNTEIDAKLEKLIAKCLAKDPDERFSSVEELAKDLSAFRDEYCRQNDVPTISSHPVTPFKAVKIPPALLAKIISAAIVIVAVFAFITNTTFSPKEKVTSITLQSSAKPEDPFASLKKRDFEEKMGLAADVFEFRQKHGVWCCKVGIANINLTDRYLRGLADHQPRFEELDVSDREVTGAGLRYLSEQPIKFLNMEHTDLNDIGAKNIGTFKKLDRLSVACCDFLTDTGMQTIANENPNLRHIEFGSATTTQHTFEIVSSIPKLRYVLLQILEHPLPEGYAIELGKLKNLTEVAFRNCHFLEASDLKDLNAVSKLSRISMWGQRISKDKIEALNTLPITELLIADTTQFEPGALLLLKQRPKFRLHLLKVSVPQDEVQALKKRKMEVLQESGYVDAAAFEL
jgi:Serine/threonine protein kinase